MSEELNDFVERVAIQVHSEDADEFTPKWAKQAGKYRSSVRHGIRSVLAALGKLGFETVKRSDLTTLRASLAEREEEVRRLREALEALRKPGAKMSNICFNLSQSSTQSAADRVSMKSCQEEWDAAAKAIPADLSPTSDHTRVQVGVEKEDPHAEAKAYLASRPDRAPTQTEIDDDESCGGFV